MTVVFVFHPNCYGLIFPYGLSVSSSNASGPSAVGRQPQFGYMRVIDQVSILLISPADFICGSII